MKKLFLSSLFLFLFTDVFAEEDLVFNRMRNELEQLKRNYGNNATLDSLWKVSNDIAEMNQKCGIISLSDVLDEECGNFFAVELPAFENKFMEVTGQVKIGSIRLSRDVKERASQIHACAEALTALYIPKGQLMNVDGAESIQMQPLDKDGYSFEASYEFRVSFSKEKMSIVRSNASIWIEKCGDVVQTKDGSIAPLFVKEIKALNDSVARAGQIDVYASIQGSKLVFNEHNCLGGEYYLGGKKVLSTKDKCSSSYLVIDFEYGKSFVPPESERFRLLYKGKKTYSAVTDLQGRWVILTKKEFDRQEKNEKMEQERIMHEKKQKARQTKAIQDAEYESRFGHFTDERDGKVYRLMKIRGKKWFAENLMFKAADSFCYEEDTSNCKKHGRLYTWHAASKACPSGWRLPTSVEVSELQKTIKTPDLLINDKDYLFNAKLGGYMDYNGNFKGEDEETRFWTNTDYMGGKAYYLKVSTDGDYDQKTSVKGSGYSVRCVAN